MRMVKRLAGVLALIVGVLGVTVLTPAAANAAPSTCGDGQICTDYSMQTLNGAGLFGQAYFLFNRHDAAGTTWTIKKVDVVNYNSTPCSHYNVQIVVNGQVEGQGVNWACGEQHNFNFTGLPANGTVLKVWLFNTSGQWTYHSLTLKDFCSPDGLGGLWCSRYPDWPFA